MLSSISDCWAIHAAVKDFSRLAGPDKIEAAFKYNKMTANTMKMLACIKL